MKKIILIALAVVVGIPAIAQPWLDKHQGQKVTLEQIENDYRKQLQTVDDADGVHEGNDYHFERWLNFWEGRTDENGYLVSPHKHWTEYKKQQELHSRASSKGTSDDANWTFHGPDNTVGGNRGIGRINVVEFHPTDTNTYLIGTPGGGIWRTVDDGMSWTALDDFLPILGIADIDYNPLNPNTIYICTGDRDANNTYSMGVFKSIDGGTTWNTTGFQYGFTETEQTTGLLINPLDTNSLTLITTDSIFKSFDGAVTWHGVHHGTYKQILYHPTDTSIMYVAAAATVLRSGDGGMNWNNVITLGANRIEMAVTPANSSLLKLVVANKDNGLEGIYSSSDTGKTFTKIYSDSSCKNNLLSFDPRGNKCGGQGWYDLSIAISPINPDHMVVGGISTWYSTDGGFYWENANQNSDKVTGVALVHADKHHHKFHPLKPGTLYECNDGGIYKSGNPMTKNSLWNTLTNGLGITQFYRNAVAGNASFVLGGAQDNGTKMLSGGVSTHISGGDGMDCQIDPNDSTILYASSQNGALKRSSDGGKKFNDIRKNITGKPAGAWITPIELHPLGSHLIYAGFSKLYTSSTAGTSWQELSPDFNDHIDRIALTKHSADYIYTMISTNSGHIVRYTTDHGNKWNSIKPQNTNPCSDIMVDPNSKDSLWITYRNYKGDKVALIDIKEDTVYKTFNIGLPEVPINCITYDKAGKTFYIGTDLGVYYREEHNVYWTYFNNSTLPNVEVFDLGINTTTQTLWAATYGRGMWSSPLHNSTVGINTIPLAADVVTIAPNPNYGEFTISTTNQLVKGSSSLIRIVSMTGAIAWQKEVQINQDGKALIQADLPRGTYVVEVLKENLAFAKTKIVVY